MKNATWVILLLVLVGQLGLMYKIDQTNRAVIGVMYAIESGTTLDQLMALNKENKHLERTEWISTSNPGTFIESSVSR